MGITLKKIMISIYLEKRFLNVFLFFKNRKNICVIQNSNPQNKSRHFTVYFLNFQIVFFSELLFLVFEKILFNNSLN